MEISKFPAVKRDLALLLDKQTAFAEVEKIARESERKLLKEVTLFDVYEGSQIKEGYKSMAYSIVFRDHERTLEEADITAVMKKILNGLTSLGIELRS